MLLKEAVLRQNYKTFITQKTLAGQVCRTEIRYMDGLYNECK